jgi:Flp pilus assembly protein CpaB
MSSSRLAALGYRLGGWPRRVVAVLCLLLAAGSALAARHSTPLQPIPQRTVVVAAHDLAAGTVLSLPDMREAVWPVNVRPPNAVDKVSAVLGRQLAGAIRTGEPITSTRLISGDIAAGLPPGLVAAPVELTSTTAGALVQPGDWVDVLTTNRPAGSDDVASTRASHIVAEAVRVLTVRTTPPEAASGGTAIVVAVDHATALRLADAAGAAVLVTIRRPP